MVSFLLPSATLNGGSSPSIDSEEDELANIYELRDREQLQLGQIIGRVNERSSVLRIKLLSFNLHSGSLWWGTNGSHQTRRRHWRNGGCQNAQELSDQQPRKYGFTTRMLHHESNYLAHRGRSIFQTRNWLPAFQSLSHPNIVEVKAILPETSTMLVMEYIPMGSLLNYLRSPNNAPITNRQLLKFATDVAEVSDSMQVFVQWLYSGLLFQRAWNICSRRTSSIEI